MPQKAWSPKRERQYEHIKDSYEDRGVSEDEAEERAARTVNKHRAETGETRGARSPGGGGGARNGALADDRRIVLVGLTEAGRQSLTDLEMLRNDLLSHILGRLDDRQLARVARALDDLRRAVAETIHDEPDLLRHAHGQAATA